MRLSLSETLANRTNDDGCRDVGERAEARLQRLLETCQMIT